MSEEVTKNAVEFGVLESLLVGFDSTNGDDEAVLIIGRKHPKKAMDVINAFQGEEAVELYKRLTTKKSE